MQITTKPLHRPEPWVEAQRTTVDGTDVVMIVQGVYYEENKCTLIQVDMIPAIKVPT